MHATTYILLLPTNVPFLPIIYRLLRGSFSIYHYHCNSFECFSFPKISGLTNPHIIFFLLFLTSKHATSGCQHEKLAYWAGRLLLLRYLCLLSTFILSYQFLCMSISNKCNVVFGKINGSLTPIPGGLRMELRANTFIGLGPMSDPIPFWDQADSGLRKPYKVGFTWWVHIFPARTRPADIPDKNPAQTTIMYTNLKLSMKLAISSSRTHGCEHLNWNTMHFVPTRIWPV